MKRYDMLYDGPRLQWHGHGIFRATSGASGSQQADKQCDPQTGPIPEGTYYLWLREDETRPAPNAECDLGQTWGIQRIPRGKDAGECEPYWAQWGKNRVRLIPRDSVTKRRCAVQRDGFFIHDSTKGHTHGCIEVEPGFFDVLRHAVATSPRSGADAAKRLVLLVSYLPGQSTNGATFRSNT